MLVIFGLEGVAMLCLMNLGHDPIWFITFAALTFLCWGEIFSLFPALCADTFGAKNAAGNAGLLYTAKGTAALLVPLASELSKKHDWDSVFIIAAVISISAAILAKVALAPMRKRTIEQANARGRP
jgi:OFA family oxalate/formate antiporter-like MFS transporter